MSDAADRDVAVRRGGWIAGHSRIAAIADAVVDGSVASLQTSARRRIRADRLREFQSLPAAERTRCLLIVLFTALAGHLVLAALLPSSSRPTLALTASALLGAGLALRASGK